MTDLREDVAQPGDEALLRTFERFVPQPALDARAERVAEAARAHERGWALTPARGKKPYRQGWQTEPRPERETVRQWAEAGNVGVRTGAISGVVVIDDDTPERTAAAVLELPVTVTAITGSGGRHHYFRLPEGTKIGNSTSKLGEMVDVKGERGMVVAVGSVHPKTKETYRWAPGLSPEEVALAELPTHIVERLAPTKAKKPERFAPGSEGRTRVESYTRALLRGHADALGRMPEGRRNEELNRSAFTLGRLVGAGVLDEGEVAQSLREAALAAGLEEREVEGTLASGLKAGMAEPQKLQVLDRQATKATRAGGVRVGPLVDADERPTILVEGGRLPKIVDEAEAALLRDGGAQLYQREQLLVRMARSGGSIQAADGVRRPDGALLLIPIEPAYLLERFTRAACFQKLDGRTGEYRVIDCTERIAASYLARKGEWRVPALLAVIEAPTLRADGSILQTPGYDAATALYFDPGATQFLAVPEQPSLDDAIDALAKLLWILKGFPFVGQADRSVALAAILTGLVRRSLRTAPLFAFRAPKMASGKSLLADIVALIASGRPAPVMTQGKDEEEDRKRLLALLLEGEAVACIDNIERPLASSALCSILTQTVYKDRILGRSGMATVPTCTTWMATGNNLVLAGDLSTRALVCDLDAGVERPEERKFEVNLYEYVPAHRAELVAAGLTILRAYHLAGLPSQGLTVFGRFEGWSDLVRSALVWCGEADPDETRRRIEHVDPVRQEIQAVLVAWHDLHGASAVTVAELIASTKCGETPTAAALQRALVDAIGGPNGDLSSLKLGHWLAKYDRRPEGGLKLSRAGQRQHTTLWKVSRA